jgi:hypothetical protein
MKMKLASPDADEVFNKFLSRINSKNLKKVFCIPKDAITVAENVKEVEKSAFLFFISEKQKQKLDSKKKSPKLLEVQASRLKEIKFYSFKESVDIDAWRGADYVPIIKNLKEVRCKVCRGTGAKKCGKCNDTRSISCENCKSKGDEECNHCSGSGKITYELKIIEINKKGNENKKYEKKSYQCPKCIGLGKITCKRCGGTGKDVCYECKGNPIACRECNGVGMSYELTESPVPLTILPGKEHYSFLTKKDEWMRKDKEYQKKLETAEAIEINEPTKLNEKYLKDLFGVLEFDKGLKKCIDDTKRIFKKLKKDFDQGKSPEKPLTPISLIFLLRLAVETPKGKKFDIYSLGTKNKYSIMTNRF